MSGGILLFDNESASASSLDYVRDTFLDTSLLPTNNTGFSNTVSRNPLQNKYANDNAPRYASKVLWIKDLIPLEDRTLWINDRPTYTIVFHEDFPPAQGYCFGAVTVNNFGSGVRLDINRIGDGLGVGGVIRRVQWIVESQDTATATAQQKVDGANTTTIDFGNGVSHWDGQPKYNAYTHAATNETRDIHDYRIEALQPGTLQVTGVVVYYEISGGAIDCFGGSTYLDKTKVVTTGTSLAVPAVTNFRGGRAVIFEDALSQFGVTTGLVTDILSVATGSSGTNLITVTTGEGASFPAGTIVYGLLSSGITHYIGNVLSVSTDTLTMGVTLPIGFSNALYHIWQAGHTYSIGQTLATKAFEFVPTLSSVVSNGTLSSPSVVLAFSDPQLRYRVWGGTLSLAPGSTISPVISGSTYGIFLDNPGSFLHIDGEFQALEFEFLSGVSGFIQATFGIDGMNCFNINEAFSGPGIFRKTMAIQGGPGWHSVVMARGNSMQQIAVSKIVGYHNKITNGPSLGVLASLDFGQTFLLRNAINSTLMAFGNVTRYYADSLNLTGTSAWVRGVSATVAGGVFFNGISGPLSAGRFSYYGSAIGFVGSMGTSFSVTIDGLAQSPTFGQYMGLALGNDFHTVLFNCNTGTTRIEAIDVLHPTGQIKNLQNFKANGQELVDNQSLQEVGGVLSVREFGIGKSKLGLDAQNLSQNVISASYAVGPLDQVLTLDTSAGVTFSIMLPLAAQSFGRPITLRKRSDDFIPVRLNPQGTDSINGCTQSGNNFTTVTTVNEALHLVSSGRSWDVFYRECDSRWRAFTPTGAFTTNSTYTGTYRRVGDSMECYINIDFAGAPNSVVAAVNLPTGITIDVLKIPGATANKGIFGICQIFDTSTGAAYTANITFSSTGAVVARGTGGNFVTELFPITIASGDQIAYFFTVPVANWGGLL